MEEAHKCTQMLIELEEVAESLRLKEESEFKELIEELYPKAKYAIETRAVEVDKALESRETLDPPLFICKEFEMLKRLDQHFEQLKSEESNKNLFIQSIKENDLYLLELLLVIGVDPTLHNNYGLKQASVFGFVDIVDRLLQDPRVDPSCYLTAEYLAKEYEEESEYEEDGLQLAIVLASKMGHLAVVERLLQDERVDPAARNNNAIGIASHNGHLAVVDRLLQDERVDPSADNNNAICWASYRGLLAVVERLLQDPRVDPAAEDNYALRVASKNGHLAVVERLKQDPRVAATYKP